MKKSIFLFVLLVAIGLKFTNAQSFKGSLFIKDLKSGTTLNYDEPVQLFKDFKQNKYPIVFNLKAKDNEIILFDMITTVEVNNKTIFKNIRKNWPWIPGDMIVPIEAFDLIPALQMQAKKNNDGKYVLSGETYKVRLEMKASEKSVGNIEPWQFSISSKK